MKKEKRSYARYIAKDNALAALGHTALKVGKIKDICMGGLAFEYIFDKQDSNVPVKHLDIIVSGTGYHLSDIPCRVVYDHPVDKSCNADDDEDSSVNNRCGLHFRKLSEDQAYQLKYFIEYHTAGQIAF